eukprot:TRINITY_DN47159_c0_g1_i1.p1 TRINITY_DN47159_c0_g1~~TRINITY_DN47159_c0_g1_i1.p1  ORF type:complete len:536 (+),score=146.50 TRINITY_DN47159_c0_g1_i1:75-1610(+)
MAGKVADDGLVNEDDHQERDPLCPEEMVPVLGWAEESAWIFKQAFAVFLAQVSWVAMKTTDSAVLGHVGTRYLSASSISDFWTMSSGVFIQGRVLGTFCGNAFGAGNHKLVGMWLQVSFAVLAVVMVPVLVLWMVTKPCLKGFGESEQIASDATYYAMVLATTLPVRILFSQLSQFFSAQGITKPAAYIAPVIMGLNLVLGVVVVLGWPIPNWGGFGFKACPVVTAGLEYVQIGLMWFIFCRIKRLHEQCWPGWSWSHVSHNNYSRVKEYVKMYVPAALAIASDFWRMALIGAVATWIGDTEAAVFNTSYRILWIALTGVGGMTTAVGIKLGMSLGKGRGGIPAAKHVIMVGFTYIVIFDAVLSVVVCMIPRQLAGIFSSDSEVHDLFEDSKYPLAWLTFVMVLSVALERIPMTMGRTKSVFAMGLVGSWIGQVPGVFLCVKLWKKDLVRLYVGAAIGYTLLCFCYGYLCWCTQWELEAEQAMIRAETKRKPCVKPPTPDPEDATSPALAE